MGWDVIAGQVLGLFNEVAKAWNEKRRTRFKDDHHDFLEELSALKNATGTKYVTSEIDKLTEKFSNFMLAFRSETEADNKEKGIV